MRNTMIILDLEDMSPDRAGRLAARSALFLLKLSSPDRESRLIAVKKSGTPPYNAEAIPFLEDMAQSDTDEKIRFTAKESLLLIRLGTDVPIDQAEQRWAAAGQLAEMKSLRALPLLEACLGGSSSLGLLLPSGMSLGIGMYITADFTIPRVLGALLEATWRRTHRRSHRQHMLVVASGFVLGEGVWSIIALALKRQLATLSAA